MKLTESIIDQLIVEALELQQEDLSIVDWPKKNVTWKPVGPKQWKNNYGFKGTGFKTDDLKGIVDLDNTPLDTLDIDDWKLHFKYLESFDWSNFNPDDGKLYKDIRLLSFWSDDGGEPATLANKILTAFFDSMPDQKPAKNVFSPINQFVVQFNKIDKAVFPSGKIANSVPNISGINTSLTNLSWPIPFKLNKGQFVRAGTSGQRLPEFFKKDAEDKVPLPSRADKLEFLMSLVPEGQTLLTGAIIMDVLNNPTKYGQKHTILVQLLRKQLDTELETNPQLAGAQIYTDIKNVLGQLKIAPTGKDYAGGEDSPVPEFSITSNMAEEGYAIKTSKTIVEIFRKQFPPTLSFQEKIEKLADYSDDLQLDSNEREGSTASEELRNLIILNFFRRVVQDYDASSAGFLFESFLALMLDGTKLGGNQRLEDFTLGSITPNGTQIKTPVTLKLLQAGKKVATSATSLFVKFFKQNPNGEILCILGEKSEGERSVKFYTRKLTADQFLKRGGKGGGRPNWLTRKTTTSGGDKTSISVEGENAIAEVDFGFMSVEDNQFYERAEQAQVGISKFITSLFKNLNNFKLNSTRYFSELEDPNSGVNALESFENLTADTDKLLGQRNKAAGKFVPTDYKAAGKKLKQQTRAKLQENKNNFDKILDKLIKEVILNK